jgi:hypothetical protein
MARYRSLWLPALLILIGGVALAANLGVIRWGSLYRLLDLWPVLLILLGLELLLRGSADPRIASSAGLALVAVAVIGGIVYVAVSPPLPTGGTLDSSQPVGSLSVASLSLGYGASDVKVHAEDLGDTLYRAHIVYTGSKPRVSLDTTTGELSIQDTSQGLSFLFGPNGRRSIDLAINSKLPWSLDVSGGASHATFDLASAQVKDIGVSGGANNVTLHLGQPSGTVAVDVSGGASTVSIDRPAGVPADVSVSGGASSVRLDNQHLGGFGDSEAKSPGYDSATDRYSISVSGGASNVSVTASANG